MVGKIKIFLVPEAQSFGDDFFSGRITIVPDKPSKVVEWIKNKGADYQRLL